MLGLGRGGCSIVRVSVPGCDWNGACVLECGLRCAVRVWVCRLSLAAHQGIDRVSGCECVSERVSDSVVDVTDVSVIDRGSEESVDVSV